MIRPATCITVLMLLSVSACISSKPSDAGETSVNVRLLYKSAFGGGTHSRPAATWITEPNMYRRTYQRLGKTTVDSKQKKLMPVVDFKRERVLLITMGQKPTGGYLLDLAKRSADVKSATAILPLVWFKPPPGAILPQVITSPCILLSLPKGDYSRIQVMDQTGRIRLQVNIDE
ncbi:MAG: protease complex subunit PrcB family protein [Planctomycetota bacterium]|nr:MAG: protease complex subunit PrcB family protein [Planctomycetota bacterium]